MFFFFIIWQSEPHADIEGLDTPRLCLRCRNTEAWQLIHSYTKNSLYWIIPMGKSRHSYRTACPICGAGDDLTREEFERRLFRHV